MAKFYGKNYLAWKRKMETPLPNKQNIPAPVPVDARNLIADKIHQLNAWRLRAARECKCYYSRAAEGYRDASDFAVSQKRIVSSKLASTLQDLSCSIVYYQRNDSLLTQRASIRYKTSRTLKPIRLGPTQTCLSTIGSKANVMTA